jgi:hypothetical protein
MRHDLETAGFVKLQNGLIRHWRDARGRGDLANCRLNSWRLGSGRSKIAGDNAAMGPRAPERSDIDIALLCEPTRQGRSENPAVPWSG